MKKIIMMVLIIATTISGITVPKKTANALVLTKDADTMNDIYDKIIALRGYTESYDTESDSYARSYIIDHTNSWEILWLSDKNGNVIVDDRKIGIHTDDDIKYTERRRSYSSPSGIITQSISDNHYLDPVDMIEGLDIKLYCADLYDAKGSGNPYFDATWSSDNPEIAEVSQDGTITAKKAGKAVIRAVATENGKEATREINVIKNELKKEQKINKGRVASVLSYDKKGNAVCKMTIKNTGKKKYRYKGRLQVSVWKTDETTNEREKVYKQYSYKAVVKPGKSKTIKINVKKLNKCRADLTYRFNSLLVYLNEATKVK